MLIQGCFIFLFIPNLYNLFRSFKRRSNIGFSPITAQCIFMLETNSRGKKFWKTLIVKFPAFYSIKSSVKLYRQLQLKQSRRRQIFGLAVPLHRSLVHAIPFKIWAESAKPDFLIRTPHKTDRNTGPLYSILGLKILHMSQIASCAGF